MTIGLAWLAGVASFLSPCVLALVPAYVAYLGGRAVRSEPAAVRGRWGVFSHGLAFVVGFSLVFVGLGAAASAAGRLLFSLHEWIARLGGLVVIVFGLYTLGLISLPFLDVDTRRLVVPDAGLGYLSSALMGVFFSAGWSPCIGPVLGAILTLALDSASLARGVLLLSAYSLGLAIPFLLAALAIGRVSEGLRRNLPSLRYVSWASGALLVVIGGMLFLGVFQQLAGLGSFIHTGL
ncbi:MAG: cytochrome c biogenesis protein CcdA [Anaerolineales bacterium]